MIEVRLNSSQLYQAANVGVIRQVRNITDNRKPRYEAGNQNDWQLHIEGCCAEMVVAQHLGLFWDGNIGILSAGDVGDLEVRSTQHSSGRLILHPKDKDQSKYILVTGVNGIYQIHGWILGEDGKQQKFWEDPTGRRPAFFIPKENLNDINSISDLRTEKLNHKIAA